MHEPVLLDETIDLLSPAAGTLFVDCTFGRGGHTREILRHLRDDGRLIAIDRDPAAIESGRETLNDERVELVHERFSSLQSLLEARGRWEHVDGILMDLGVSSPQLDDAGRGFSFRADGPLDMRMDPTTGESAAHFIATASEDEIRECLWRLGEERHGRRIARRIVEARQKRRIGTTGDLIDVIRAAVPPTRSRIHPATRTFQAIRLHVNDELGELERGLDAACRALAVGGRAVVIAFHSLEDRIVKRHFRDLARTRASGGAGREYRVVTRKPIRPDEAEVGRNPRARSARLRALERVA